MAVPIYIPQCIFVVQQTTDEDLLCHSESLRGGSVCLSSLFEKCLQYFSDELGHFSPSHESCVPHPVSIYALATRMPGTKFYAQF